MYEKQQFNTPVWGSLMFTPIVILNEITQLDINFVLHKLEGELITFIVCMFVCLH